jgi:hypothetical protein
MRVATCRRLKPTPKADCGKRKGVYRPPKLSHPLDDIRFGVETVLVLHALHGRGKRSTSKGILFASFLFLFQKLHEFKHFGLLLRSKCCNFMDNLFGGAHLL